MKVVKPKIRFKRNPKGKEYSYVYLETPAELTDRYLLKNYEFERILEYHDAMTAFYTVAQHYLLEYITSLQLDVKVNRRFIEELASQLATASNETDRRTILMAIRIKQKDTELKVRKIREIRDKLLAVRRAFPNGFRQFDELIGSIDYILQSVNSK